MAHSSGNPTWKDFPDTTTLVTANGLEAIELLLDGVMNRPVCEARLTADYVNLGTGWYLMQGQMAVPSGSDPFGMFQQPSGAGTNYQVVIPPGWGGRYDVLWQTIFTNIGTTTCASAVLLNCPDTVNGATPVGQYSAIRGHAAATGQTAPVSCFSSVKLAAGDRLAFAVTTSLATWTLTAVQNGFTRTKLVVRYVGSV